MRGSLVVGAALVVSLASCTDQTTPTTYSDGEGNVWYASDCPDADHVLFGDPDGLPAKGETDLEKVQALVGDSGRTAVIPRNGEVWERESDGSITVMGVNDYMIEATLADAGQCPPMPMTNNGVPLVFKIRETTEVEITLRDGGDLTLAYPSDIDLASDGVEVAEEVVQDGSDARMDGSSGSLLVFIDDCDRMTRLDEEVYGNEVFAFCDEPSNILFFVAGSAEVQQRIHESLEVNPSSMGHP